MYTRKKFGERFRDAIQTNLPFISCAEFKMMVYNQEFYTLEEKTRSSAQLIQYHKKGEIVVILS